MAQLTPAPTTTAKPIHPKKKEQARKEGAKKGQDLSGLEEMGGVRYFHVALDNSDGNWELIEEAMEGANTPVEANADERKGGAAKIGKALLSASDDRLCIYLHVPEEVTGNSGVTIQDWFAVLVKSTGATIVQAPPTDKVFGFAKAEVLQAPEVFPLKLRDTASSIGFQYLRQAKVIPEEESSMEMEEMDNLEW